MKIQKGVTVFLIHIYLRNQHDCQNIWKHLQMVLSLLTSVKRMKFIDAKVSLEGEEAHTTSLLLKEYIHALVVNTTFVVHVHLSQRKIVHLQRINPNKFVIAIPKRCFV